MSFDLLAEFGSPPPPQSQQQRLAHPQPSPAARPGPGTASFSLFDDLAGLSQPSTPAIPNAVSAHAFSPGVGGFSAQGMMGTPASTQVQSNIDDDFGDFADASTPAQSAALPNPTSINTAPQAPDPWASLRTSTSLTGTKAPSGISTSPAPPSGFNPAASRSDPFDFSAFGVPSRQQNTNLQQNFAAPPPAPAPSKAPAPRDPNVLFDAENLSEDDDDFGDFEDATPASEQPALISSPVPSPAPVSAPKFTPETAFAPKPKPKPSQPQKAAPIAAPATTALNIDELLGELEVSDPLTSVAPTSKQEDWKTSTTAKFASKTQPEFGSTQPPAAKTTSASRTSSAAKKTSKTPAAKSRSIGPQLGWDDDWDDLISTTPAAAQATSSNPVPSDFQVPAPTSIPDPTPNSLPPTNIPPPALLLTLFPPIFSSAQTSFFKPLGTQPTHIRPKILADQNVVRFLRGYLTVGIVAARVIAGRKLRWKRDSFLAQGMSIGPAGKAGAGGMKLTAIDRSESSKEDREAADVVRAWKEQVGRLRSVVVQVNAKDDRGRSLGSIPEIAETMPIRTAKELEGGIAAPKPCALCGLKRNERIGKVDLEVEDSFGEWWVDQLSMHRACRNFWEEHKNNLRY